jgi:hypothetical protein
MLVVFSSAGIANGHVLTKLQSAILDLSLYALPLSCVLSAGLVLLLYWKGSGTGAYWWYVLPVVAAVAYLVFALVLNAQTPSQY